MTTLPCRDFQGEIHNVPKEDISTRASVYGVVFNDTRTAVLLVKHFDGYDFPGGGVKVGQKLDGALAREVLEETGFELNTSSLKLLDVATDLFFHNFKNRAFQTILIYYQATLTKKAQGVASKSASESNYMGDAEWVDLNRIPELKFYNAIDSETLIKKALAQVF